MNTSQSKSKINDAINFGKSLVGIPYGWWSGGDCDIKGPMWAENGPVPKNINSCNCAGLANLILRYMNKELPYIENITIGGTLSYFTYYESVSEPFDIDKTYPIGTLLMRNFRDIDDQGHVAIIIENTGKISKVLQSHIDDTTNGVNIDYSLEESHCGDYYEKIVLPENWLIN